MASFLPKLPGFRPRSGRVAAETKSLLADYYSALVNAGINVGGQSKPWPLERAVAEGYERVIWVFKCVDTIASNTSRIDIPFRFRVGKQTVDDHPMYRLLNLRANPLETGPEFRHRLSGQLSLSKRGVFVEETRSNAGTPVRLDLLPPGRTRLVPGRGADLIDRVEVTRLDGTTYDLDFDRVRWIRKPHPIDPFAGITPLEAMGLSVELDYFARLFNVSFMRNDSRPGGVLGVAGDADEKSMEYLERRLGRGPIEAGKMAVLNGALTYVDTAARPRDMQYIATTKNSRSEILAGFGVSDTVMGQSQDRTYANAEVDLYVYWSITQAGHFATIASGFDDDDPETVPFFDTSVIEALQVPLRERRKEAREEFQAGLRSAKSYAELAGFGDEIPDTAQTHALWIPAGTVAIPTRDGDAASLGAPVDTGTAGAEPPPPGGGEALAVPATRLDEVPAGTPAADVPGVTPAGGTPGGAQPALTSGKELPQPAARPHHPHVEIKATPVATWVDLSPADTESPAAAALTDALSTMAVGWVERAARRVSSPKARKGTRHWEADRALPADTRAGTKALDAAYAADQSAAGETGAARARPIVEDAAIAAAAAWIGSVIATTPPGIPLAGVAAAVQAAAGGAAVTAADLPLDLVEKVRAAAGAVVPGVAAASEHLARRIGAVITAADSADSSIGDVVSAVREHAPDAAGWADSVAADAAGAATEAGWAAAAAAVAVDDSGAIDRQWHARRDEKTRDTHSAAHGQTKALGEPFTVGTASLRFPRDPLGPPEETIHCRCRTVWRHRVTGRFHSGVAI